MREIMSMSLKKDLVRDICWVLTLLIIQIKLVLDSIVLIIRIKMDQGLAWLLSIEEVFIFL